MTIAFTEVEAFVILFKKRFRGEGFCLCSMSPPWGAVESCGLVRELELLTGGGVLEKQAPERAEEGQREVDLMGLQGGS